MNIWLIQVGEPTPTEELNNERLMRIGLLSHSLADRGHNVTWWSTTFDHARKKYRYLKPSSYTWQPKITIHSLHSPTSYRKNISIPRIINHYQIANDFRRRVELHSKPDMILAGMPTPELCAEAVEFGRRVSVPVLLDIRDLWPDDLIHLTPSPFRMLARLILFPMASQVKRACKGASGICATSSAFVDWGLHYAGRTKGKYDADFPLGYSDEIPSDGLRSKAVEYWSKHGITKNGDEFIVCFFGALGATCLLRPIIDVARRCLKDGREVRFVICGKGDRFEEYHRLSKNLRNMLFTGWVGHPEIWTLMRIAKVGLVPVKNIFSYRSNYPNKTIEYMSAGLPLLSCLKGIVGNLIESEEIGLVYDENNVDDLYLKLCQMMDRPDVRLEMSDNSRQLFERQFSAEKVYRKFSEHLESVVGRSE